MIPCGDDVSVDVASGTIRVGESCAVLHRRNCLSLIRGILDVSEVLHSDLLARRMEDIRVELCGDKQGGLR